MSDPPSASRRPQSSSSSTSSSYYDRLRSQTLDHAETPATRVEVNQRALIDKILARYASASAVYRELLQNSNDAGATVAEIHFTTAITSANSTATATTALFTTKQTTNDHHHDASNGNSSNNSAVVTQVVYRNNGMPFRDQDWDRLQKIAEGNPDVSKIGAFGVGAYTMFSITEEPVIVSGDTCLLFCWRGDSLYTKTAPYHHANNDNDENQWTTFVLPSRDVYPLPHWQEFGEFLTAALTFTGSLHQIKVTVNGHERLRLRKTILQPPRPIQTPSSSSSLTKTTVTNTTSAVTAFLWNSVFTNGGNSSGGGSSTSSHGRNNSFTTTTTLFALEQVQESLVRITVKVTADDSCDGSVAAAAASMDARYITATAKTNIAKEMAHRMERVTKKKPPPTVTVQVFLNYNEPTAHLVPISMPSSAASAAGATSGHHHYRHHVTSTTNKTHQEQQDMAVRIAQSFAPVLGQGRIFIGFRTSQTTGLAAHVAAPFVPTVEREAMDLHDAVLARFNTELLEFSGLVLRLALEHTMRNVIDVAWQAQRLEREALERQYAGQQQSQKNTIASLVENNGSAKKITLTTNTNKQEDDEDDSDEAGTSSTGFMTFARYMARGVQKKIVSVAKTVEIMMERDGSSDQLLHPPDLRPLVDEEKQAIVLMSSFCPQQSTPDPAVGTALANGFSRCMPNSAPPVLTRSGVVPGNEAFLPHCGIEGFVSEGVIRTVVFKNAEEYHTVVARCRRLNFDDLMKVVSKTVLEQEKAVNLIKWWTRFSQVDALNRSVVQTRGIALKEAIRFYPQSDKERATALLIENGASKPAITKLNELLFYAETNSPFARRDMPLPDTVIPGPLQDAIGMTALTSDVLNYSWFSPFPIELFAECMGHHSCLNDAQPEDDLLRVKVLTVLCREYMRRQGSEREVFGGLCHSILSNRRCLPFDSDQPTLFAADFPTDLYLYSAELKAFDGVGSFYKVARSLQVAGVTDEFLLTLGVRKSVSIDFLFSHLDTLNWSRNPMALIEYLRSATLTRSDLHKLSTTKYLPATNDNSTTYAPGELYLPNKDLHVFPFIRMLQWPESEVSESSENGKFLRRLGIKTMPSLVQVLSFLSDENSSDDQRVKALDFVSDRLVPNGIYYNSYSSMALSEKKKYRFLPCVVQFPFEAVTSLHQRQSPVSCFSEKSCAVMGFPVIDPQLGKQGLLYGTIFQCEPEPQASYLLNQLAHLVAVAKDKLKSTSKKDQNEVGQCIEATFHKIFQYLSHRSADLNYSTFETLARESFIPCLKNDMMRWHRPDEVFFKRVNRGNDTLTEELFHVIDFSPFLAAAGVKEDASTKEVFQKILQSPEDVLRALGSERKYRALLRRVAADPPFTLSRPSTGIKNCPFLLAYTVKPFSEQKSEKSESLVEDKLIYHLAKAEDIYIIDNSNYGRMFPVYRGPQETDLEDFYISLGSQYISKSVDRRCEVVGSPRTDTALTKALKDILRERGPLLVSPNVTSRPLVPGASSIIDEKRLECYEVTNLLAIYTLGKISRRSRTTCFSRPSANKKNAIFVTRDFDLFDVGQAIGDLILKRCQLEDAFFISSLLDTPLDQLRARGFPVDRILKAEPVVVPEEQKPEPQMVPQAPKRAPGASVPHLPTVAPLTTAEAAEASNGQKEAVPLKSFPPSPTSTDPSGPVKASGSNVAGGPPSATNSKADILMQMFPDAEPNFLQAALGHDPSVDDVKDLADKMVNGHYPRKNGSDSVTQAPSNSSVDDFNDEVTSAKKKSLRHRFGRAFGGKKGSSHGGAHLPFPSNQSKLGYSGGGYAAPLGANKSVEKRGPVSPAVDAQTQNSLERMLEQEVGKSNRVTKDDIDAPETNLTSIPPDLDRGETCEVIPGHSLEPFLGPRGNGLTHNGIFVFSSKEYASSETFLDENVESLRCFADVLERLCVDVFGLKLATIAIYHDPAGVSIAFNRNKALHFNMRFFHGLHWLQSKHNTSECYAYWFITMCHELAHHFVSGHTKEHGFYCENYSQLYLPKLMALLRDLKID